MSTIKSYILESAISNMAEFPMRVSGTRGTVDINEFEEGWNAALRELFTSIEGIKEYLCDVEDLDKYMELLTTALILEYTDVPRLKTVGRFDLEATDVEPDDLPFLLDIYEKYGKDGISAWTYHKQGMIPKKGYIDEYVDDHSRYRFNEATMYLTRLNK